MATAYCRSIKRAKVEVPDYYPQANNQKEDELTEENVKRGYTNIAIGNLTPHEYTSAKDSISKVPFSKFAEKFNAILTEKQKNNTFQDVHKKKPVAQNKEFFLPITSKTKSHVSSWLQDLASKKSLSVLASRKVPIFNKKEELLNSVCEHSVPLIRATWFIKVVNNGSKLYKRWADEVGKMTSAHQMALISDSRNKKRQASEPAQEWTATITKYLKDQLNKLSDFYHQSFHKMSADVELAQKQWHYTVRLTDWLYEENLLDRQEFFHWVVELMEKVKSDDMILKLILPVVLRYLDQIVHSQLLSRNLALCCARKLSTLLSAAEQMRDEQKQNQSSSSSADYSLSSNVPPSTKANAAESDKGPQSLFSQYKTCAHHQSLVNGLSCILQVVTICCPGALIWNSIGSGLTKSRSSTEQSSKKPATSGSALDRLALSPSELQLPAVLSSSSFKKQVENLLVVKEEEIKTRSKAVEKRWSVDSGKTSVMEVTKILEILDFLDNQNFNKVEGTMTTDDLYVNIFGGLPKDCTKVSAIDEAISILLIQWVISAHRMGRHRSIIVAKLLKKRQSHLRDQLEKLDGEEEDETSSKTSNCAAGDPYFQNISLKFLDSHAPVWGNDEVSDSRFCQLVMLFGELIRMDVFSHNAYLCTLISRGDLEPTPANTIRSTSSISESVLTSHEGPGKLDSRQQEMLHYSTAEESRRSTDSNSKLIKQLELEQELMLHQEQLQKLLYQDSDPPDDGFASPFTGSSGFKFDEFRSEKPSNASVTTEPASTAKETTQHSLYVKHFPIPKEDNTHELNQRLVVLYGVGKPRATAMKSIKEFGKELVNFLTKLGEFSGRKIEDDKVKSIAEKKQSVYRKFCSFSTFDQYSWVTKCIATVKETASAHMENYGVTALYPTFGQLSFIIDLFETCNNIPDMLEFLVHLLEHRGKSKFNPNVPQETSVYGTLPTKSLLVLGTLRKHQSILLLYPELAKKIFDGFLTTVENISDPAVCSSTERCILAYLFYLYTSCTYVKGHFIDRFDTACNKIKESIICFSKSGISTSSMPWDDKFLSDYFENSSYCFRLSWADKDGGFSRMCLKNVHCSSVTVRLLKEKLDVIWKQLMAPDMPEEIYSFVCNAIINVCNCQDRERLYDIGVLCSEVTAHYKALSSEWITVLKALCFSSSNPSTGYTELMDETDFSETSFHESICLFTAMLIARSCFSLEDLITHALLPALPAAVDSGNKIIFEAEPGAQLACQLLFRLLDQSTDNPIIPLAVDKFSFEPIPDRALLYSAEENIQPGMIFAVLKAIMKFSEAESRGNEHETSLNANDDIFRGLFNDDLIDVVPGQSTDVFSSSLMSNKSGIETTSTSSFANSILQKLCSQEWLKEKCLRDRDTLFSEEALLDPKITDAQAKKLLHLICYPNSFPQTFSAAVEGFPSSSGAEIECCKESANRILKNLNHWSFRNSWLELYLMLNKADKEKMEVLLDCISSACLSLFVESRDVSKNLAKDAEKRDECIKGPEWLVEPLINKLSSGLHGRILKTAGDVLGEKGWWKDQKENGGPSLIHAMPFLHLILSCLQTLGDQREPLLMSLLKQFQDLLEAPMEESHPTDKKSKTFLQDALDLRLRLVGVMFNSIASPKNLQMTTDWGIVLFDLISCGILSTESVSGNLNHYTNVLDMLSVLINLITSPDTTTNQLSDDGRKFSSALFKRLKRKLCGKNARDIEHCKQLLPFPGRSIEVVTVEKSQQNDFSIHSESQSSSLESEDTQEGFQVKGRQKISPWELIEGHKNPAPMAFSWFGAVRIERKPLPHQTDLSRSVHHNFVKKRPLSYYINPPDDSDDDSMDLSTSMLGSPGNLATFLEPKVETFSSLTNLNAAVKRESPYPAAAEQQPNGEKSKGKRQKKNFRAAHHQQQSHVIQQQKLLQEHNFKGNPQMFQQAERPYQQPGQAQAPLGVRRLQRPQGKTYSIGQPMMLIPKSQPDHLQQRPSVQPMYSGRPPNLQNKQISQSPLVPLTPKRRQIAQSGMHVDESPIQQLLQSNQAYSFAPTQSTQLPVSSHAGLSAEGPNAQQQLSHQQQRDPQPMQQSFPSGNLQQSSTLLQHPITSSLRLPVAGQQKQFSQGAISHPKQSELRACLLRQTPVAAQNNPVNSQLILKRQMSAPANLSLNPPQYSAASDVSYQGQMPQTQNLAQSGQTQHFPNFQPSFQ